MVRHGGCKHVAHPMRGMPLGSQTSHRLAGNMNETQLGILLWNQGTDWPTFERAARRVDELGYEHLWAWDHLYAIFGDPYQPIYEAYTTLAAWAMVTLAGAARPHGRCGHLPQPRAGGQDDHQSRPDEPGRAMLGIGAARSSSSTPRTGSTSAQRGPAARLDGRGRRRVPGAAESRLAHLPSPGGTTSSTTCAPPARCSPGWRS